MKISSRVSQQLEKHQPAGKPTTVQRNYKGWVAKKTCLALLLDEDHGGCGTGFSTGQPLPLLCIREPASPSASDEDIAL